ncbi:hypothetical protein VTN31DRAFT_4700 [Thermomyces dupontii]|uniref:uncharacterized protein n=1 Tax=Talaromyces thermophilus TaxID=28565 RepID=UPI003742B091
MEESVPLTPSRKDKDATLLSAAAGHGTKEVDGEEEVGDHGDYETVATVLVPHEKTTSTQTQVQATPLTQRYTTQPTQILDQPQNNNNNGGSVVQVAASSPIVPSSSPVRRQQQQQSKKPSGGGILSKLMAPPGTQFRPPQARPIKRASIEDEDEDDEEEEEGPLYRGGSSDDDEPNGHSTDIKPATFAKRSPERILESPVKNSTNPLNRFKDITSAAVYNPAQNPAKRSSDGAADRSALAKKPRQDTSSRARPVNVKITSLDDIDDPNTRKKVQGISAVFPNKSIQSILNALIQHEGNRSSTVSYLGRMQDAESSSEDELARPTKRPVAAVPAAKQQIKARETIFDKFSNIQRTQERASSEDSKPKRRLIRGTKKQLSPPPSSSTSRSATPRGRLVKKPQRRILSSDDEDDSAVESEPRAGDTSGPKDVESQVLQFINRCSAAELADLAATSEQSAATIIAHRPFSSMDAVREVMGEEAPTTKNGRRARVKPIGDKIADKCIEMWRGYEAVDALVVRCEELGKPLAEEMKKWGVDIFGKKEAEFELVSLDHDSGVGTPATDDDGDAVGRAGGRKPKFISQPSIMNNTLTMKNYQIVGINWLSLMFDKGLSCILADDMGLGKTCQVIAFLAHLYEIGVKGPHLVIVPSSTLENWLREFQKFCPTLEVMPYYAKQHERAELRETIESNREQFNVVITTYTVAKSRDDARFLRSLDFCVCVYDEGHVLKNHESKLYEKLVRIPAQFRLLLTGTPLQNNLQELVSLLGFLLPKVFEQHREDLQYIFAYKGRAVEDTGVRSTEESNNAASSHSTLLLSAQRISRARSMLAPFVLRRKKHQVIDLPPKISRVEYCELNPTQREIYEQEKEEVRKLLADRAAGKRTGTKSAHILMKLRQAAIHPLLKRRLYTDQILSRMAKACLREEQWARSNPNIIFEELQLYNDFECHTLCVNNPKSLGKFALRDEEWMDSGKVAKLAELLRRFRDAGDRTLIFSQFTLVMDILEYVLETLQMRFFRLDGRTSVEDRQSILDAFYEQRDVPVFMLSTKAGGAGINLACANKVIIFDSSFNPQEDVQAENRAHRVGQTRPVEVIRLITRDTIEEQIYALGQTKLALDQRVVGDDDPAEAKRTEEEGIRVVTEMMAADLGS